MIIGEGSDKRLLAFMMLAFDLASLASRTASNLCFLAMMTRFASS